MARFLMVHSDSGWTRGVQVKLWDPLRTRAIPDRLGAFTTRRYTNPRLPLPLPLLGSSKQNCDWHIFTVSLNRFNEKRLCFCGVLGLHCSTTSDSFLKIMFADAGRVYIRRRSW